MFSNCKQILIITINLLRILIGEPAIKPGYSQASPFETRIILGRVWRLIFLTFQSKTKSSTNVNSTPYMNGLLMCFNNVFTNSKP